jgi:hypothetical protein
LISAIFGREGEILSRFLLAQFFPPSLPKGRSANHKELAPPLKATGVEKNGRNFRNFAPPSRIFVFSLSPFFVLFMY